MSEHQYVAQIESALEMLLPQQLEEAELKGGKIPPMLAKAMRYSLLQGGKRLRPTMLLAAVDMLGGCREDAVPYACAVEMIHCYSLIHDDLPGMDDDELRRGQPTNHIVFGEGQAILAGDGLLSMAFETMCQAALSHPAELDGHMRAIAEIARGAGVRGMVAGQSLDLMLESRTQSKLSDLQFIHEGKTAAMFIYPLRAAGRLCGADEAALDALTRYGRAFGMLFQTVDDLLDEEGDETVVGKRVGKDRDSGKLTAVSLFGTGGATELKQSFMADGIDALDVFGEKAEYLREMIRSAAVRKA